MTRSSLWFLAGTLVASGACSSNGGRSFGGDDGGAATDDAGDANGDDVAHFGDAGGDGSQCPGGGSTTISGTIYDPAAKNPLYGVVAYVPSKALSPIKFGASCDPCKDLYSGDPVASAITDASGKFVIHDAPAGANVPVVLQIGKWRKLVVVPSVAACQDNPQPDKTLTLPRNHVVGDIPSIAIATGNADSLECLLSRIGIDSSEYQAGTNGPGHIHVFTTNSIFSGPGPNTQPSAPDASQALWSSSAQLMPYDVVLLSCEGTDLGTNPNQQALFDYANAGGRVFASHFHYLWFTSGPFASANLAQWTAGSNGIGTVAAQIVTTLPNNQPFPKGQAMQQWLGNVGALTAGKLQIVDAKHNADVTPANTASQAWITVNANSETQYFSVDTPTGKPTDQQCGRVVYSDLHVGGASGDYGGNIGSGITPSGCAHNDLSPQEKALEFMLFDLASCITPHDKPPEPPPPVK